ncbi:hypothetical protein C4N20_06645 [Fusobacterium ulcerans]|uniref:DUF4345 domain-containing protein n=2 Tax=Fusobacteriaceae TaxID=203492 RepID=A0AAX2JG89_9FUSO|nr:hypothetical protein [Fusobacterium ulcerans]AVQ27763.1 hypothetical protein C4N20_06645 [Fusobacterium ulcerans]EFS27539.1 hypothetical protein FUAG_03054 [Fusobacterium ulcerans ATCC 49185]SQJ16484.1 Uncharacterised protein [Fusobacterium ulcerans]
MKKPLLMRGIGLIIVIAAVLKLLAGITIMLFPLNMEDIPEINLYGRVIFSLEYILGSLLYIIAGVFLILGKKRAREMFLFSIIFSLVVTLLPGMIITIEEMVVFTIFFILLCIVKSVKEYFQKFNIKYEKRG